MKSPISPNNTQAPRPTMGESKFLLQTQTGRNLAQHPQELTPYPYSAVCFRNCCFPLRRIQEQPISDQQFQVSSFNLPSYCDTTLITPVATRSPTMAGNIEQDRDIKLSSSNSSPRFHFLPSDDDFSSGRFEHNPPMKHKSPSGALIISNWSDQDNSFPASPHIPEPFYGSFGVSATTPISRRSGSSPIVSQSPLALNSAGGFSNSGSSLNRPSAPPQSLSGYAAVRNQAPKLIAPTPSALRPATKQERDSYRQKSLGSNSTAPGSATLSQKPFPESVGSLPPKGNKRKSPSIQNMTLDMARMTEEERVVYDLRLHGKFTWKEIEKKFEENRGTHKREAALQMQLNRTAKRLRIWTEEEVLCPIRTLKKSF